MIARLERGGRALAGEARLLLAALYDWRLALLLGCFAALLLLAAQAPLRYAVQVGQADGLGSDLPILDGFFPPERDPHGLFRWTSERASIRLPGAGQRPLQIALTVFPVNPEVAQRGPREVEVWDGGQPILRLPAHPEGAIYRFVLPAPADGSGDHMVELRSATFIPTGDQRSIGIPVNAVSATAGGPGLPAWRSTLGWLAAAALAWLALRRAGIGPSGALALLPAALLAGLAALLDPPRFAFGAGPALIALALAYLLVLLLAAKAEALLVAGALLAAVAAGLAAIFGAGAQAEGAVAPAAIAAGAAGALLLAGWLRPPIAALYRRLGGPVGPRAARWLIVFALLVFALRYGGKIYPDSMPGDIGFHTNRYSALVRGSVLQLSLNRGVYFPYPPALYLLLAPFSLLGLPTRVLLQLGGALVDALSPFLVYAIAARVRRDAALLAAAIYCFSAAGFMTTWWNFSTHIFAQFAHLLLIAALVLLGGSAISNQIGDTRHETSQDTAPVSCLMSPAFLVAVLVVLQSLVYFGHFGFWINMTLLWGIGLAVLMIAATRGRVAWALFRAGLLSFLAAELLAGLLFYSNYAGLFLEQIQVTLAGGLTGLAGRAPVGRDILWRTFWDAGLRTHFGFFPVPLAIAGLLLARRRTKDEELALSAAQGRRAKDEGRPTTDRTADKEIRRQGDSGASNLPVSPSPGLAASSVVGGRWSVIILIAGTFAIGAIFAALPFLSGSTLSTRWLMFSAWAVAVGAALSARIAWRHGWAGRLAVWAMAGYVIWVTASVWLMALAWRIRPPEPF